MFLIIRRKWLLIAGVITLILTLIILSAPDIVREIEALTISTSNISSEELTDLLNDIFNLRNNAMLREQADEIKPLYNLSLRNSLWAYEHETKKIKYLHQWSDKQGIKFTEIKTKFYIRWSKRKGAGVTVNLAASTEYIYIYENEPHISNVFRIGTYHDIELMPVDNVWRIMREWYTDPFADSLKLDNIKTDTNKQYVISQSPRDFTKLITRRKNAVNYADRYCGAAADEEYGWKYNPKYRDYNSMGGDCTNFASQVLFEGGNFRKTSVWNYNKDGSKAWLNAQAFKNYLLYSGRASLIDSGSYEKVFKSSFKLLPGDIIAYEKKGKVAHISVVTGADNKGYSLVNSHNTDRYRVPWDLGWSDAGIKFYLIRIHY